MTIVYAHDSETDTFEETHSDCVLGEQTHSYHEDATHSDCFSSGDNFTIYPPWSQTVAAVTARFTRDITSLYHMYKIL